MITPGKRAQIGDALADALELPTQAERAAAVRALDARPPEPAIKLPRVMSDLRVHVDFSKCPRPAKGRRS